MSKEYGERGRCMMGEKIASNDVIEELDDRYAARIKAKCATDRPEEDHILADKLLLKLLTEVGFVKTCEAFRNVERWYE